ncbi:MAG: hypothetical protein U0V56_07030 [Actinomycetota bacterium]
MGGIGLGEQGLGVIADTTDAGAVLSTYSNMRSMLRAGLLPL